MKKTYDYDVVVVGGGSAGIAAAERAAEAGVSVCLIEEAQLGGECSFSACTPTKALLHAARLYYTLQHDAPHLGIFADRVRFDLSSMQKRKDALLETLYQQGFLAKKFLQERGVDVVKGRGRFFDDHTILVGASKKITGKAFVIATGAVDAPLSFPCEEDVPVLRYRDVVSMRTLTRSVIVIGGGPIGCEFTTLLNFLGVKVTLLQHAPHILVREEADLAALAEASLRERGAQVVCDVQVLGVKRKKKRVEVVYQVGESPRCRGEADALFVATGRIPHTAGLQLEGLKTRKHIFFAGDVTGSMQFTSVAATEGSIAGWNAAHVGSVKLYETFDDRVTPRVTFVFPELASVGLTLRDAKKKDKKAFAYSVPVRTLARAAIDDRRGGMLKVVLAGDGERILGAHLLGERAGEVIHEYALAMRAGVSWSMIRTMLRAYPTYSEIVGM
ncbi:NAD(P)/FAD-dependent oxidoreductase [bacterium]|nr:NAD(P)/FAD-dependent oxidoreductase [bacterium]